MLSRRNIDTAASPLAGGWPRPSLRWQCWHERALYSGPSPSDAVVDDGAETQILRNTASPTLKSSSRSNDMLADDWEKALGLTSLKLVAAPPGRRS